MLIYDICKDFYLHYHCKLGCGEDDECEEDAEGVGDEERGEQLREGEGEVQLGAQQEPRRRDVTCTNNHEALSPHLSRANDEQLTQF